MRIRHGAAIIALLAFGCSSKPKPDPAKIGDAARPVPTEPAASVEHGKELVGTFQCNRCHQETGHVLADASKDCVGCHRKIVDDKFEAPAASMARWKPRVKDLADAPSLLSTGARFKRDWVKGYLLQPSDLRPHLRQFMPRLAISASDARDIAAYLVPEAEPARADLASADLGKGRQLLETKGCSSCHAFTGVAALANAAPPPMNGKDYERGHKLAPDLRFARDRMSSAKMLAWIEDPKAVKHDTAMPNVVLTKAEVNDLAGYIMNVEITPPASKPKPARLPVLTRKVTFKEVDEKVFHRTCWHCHSEPDYAIGDGGPGNSGGFGFKPRGLNLSDYNGIAAGYLDDQGERASVFLKDTQEVPRLVRALLARHDEEAGAETGAVRGMPLGYDPLPLEEIQLVETWIAQGRPR